MRHFKIYYNDGVYAETISFDSKTNEFIEECLADSIAEYNQNINSRYHITRDNIKEVF
jgi:hypothetical protein